MTKYTTMATDIDLLSSYDYYLPPNLIASTPTLPKEEARLLVYERGKDKIHHLKFKNLHEILPDCSIIFNDTKVVKARILGKKNSGGSSEILLNTPLNDNKFSVYIKGKVKIGTLIKFDKDLVAKVCEIYEDGTRVVEFTQNNQTLDTAKLFSVLEEIGHVPLPPYIKRADNRNDESWYQSIFARHQGAVAAPTASLHFNDKMIKTLKKDHDINFLTLHVGAGTFKGVESENIKDHLMHGEFYEIPSQTQDLINSNKQILGIGTTVTRCVEEFARSKISSGECKLFLNLHNRPIRQNYLLTNFHLPKSTLIMLVTSFIGLDKTMEIYKTAIQKEYKFYSYGDGMLII
ncbi:tRNA preQ1(34) S-adenosylmethionine ribosyltransferase-isomerase QueA [Campylobacter sp. RM16192]|uniref:tRNA preQ1(34) S-adenosylmethionine ribosyltransferase-isomerase QueA n=1 Tax=Campylobacter sp. RM16192 TaxID=1660080 RepID=UPI001451C8C4|nr:S-adenosylmethionine:tRNA ribosyltransferase-isomerase [Campylobacter sp. RM16192]